MALRRGLWIALALAIPVAIVFFANASSVFNHWHVGPFLLDTGWYASIVWRQGVFPKNVPLVDGLGVPEYYGIHFSPVVSIGSLASYLYPGDRTDWYCIFQGAVYAPLGLATGLLFERGKDLRAAAMIGLASLVFAFNGQVLACIGYPHFEALIPGAIAVMLAGFASGRTKTALAGAAVAALTREDGGLHVACFSAAIVASDLLGRPFAVRRRTAIAVTIAGLVWTGTAMLLQKRLFHSANLFRHEYLGDPAYAHITFDVFLARCARFVEMCRFILVPFAATAVLALTLRDGRFMLGWLAQLPWFVLNFFAAQDLKSVFSIYTGFPFIASIFWVGAYAVVRQKATAERPPLTHTLAPLAFISLCALVGLRGSYPAETYYEVTSLVPKTRDHRAFAAFASELRRDPLAYGNVWFDMSMSAWAPDRLTPEMLTLTAVNRPDKTLASLARDCREGVAFFGGRIWPDAGTVLAACSYPKCGKLRGTQATFCASATRTLPAGFEPVSPFLDALIPDPTRASHEGTGLRVVAGERELAAWVPPFAFFRGRYRATWAYRNAVCASKGELPWFEVWNAGVLAGGVVLAPAASRVVFEFEVKGTEPPTFEARIFTGSCTFVLEKLEIEGLP